MAIPLRRCRPISISGRGHRSSRLRRFTFFDVSLLLRTVRMRTERNVYFTVASRALARSVNPCHLTRFSKLQKLVDSQYGTLTPTETFSDGTWPVRTVCWCVVYMDRLLLLYTTEIGGRDQMTLNALRSPYRKIHIILMHNNMHQHI